MNILQMSFTATFLIVAIIILRSVALNRLPKFIFLALWGIVLLRLLVPFQWEIPVAHATNPMNPINLITSINQINPANPANPINAAISPQSADENLSTANFANLQTLLTVLYILGTLATAAVFLHQHSKSKPILQTAYLLADNSFLEMWLAEHKLHRKITIMTSEQVQTPIVMGIFRPVIILPANMDLSDTELLNYVLMHEFYHIKRFDLLWKTLMAAAVCLHWFNPLAWAMLSLVNRDLELACDETVLKHFGSEKRESYAYSIIGMAEWQNLHRQIYAGFGKNAAEERIESIMKFSRKTLATMAISAAAVGAAFLVGFTAITPQVPQSADFASAENSDFAGFSANSVISEPGEIGELAELAETAESAESSETAENPKKISMQQALEIAEDFIGNPADSIVWDDNIFVVSIPEETGRYELQLDDETGQILRAELVILPETAQESEIFEPQESLTVVEVAYIPPVSQVSQAPQPTIGNITAEDARQIAMQFLGRGTIVRHETKKDYIKVCIQDGNEHHDIKVRYDGTIYKNSARPIVHTDSKALAQDRSHIISHEQAAQIALDQIGGGVVIENKLKYKSKEGLLYEITVVVGQVEHKIIVSAVGEVVKFSSKVKP